MAGLAVVAIGLLAAGFFVGRAIGEADTGDSGLGSAPTRIVTRAAVVASPTFSRKGEIPPLETTTPPESEPESNTEAEEPATSGATPEEAEETPTPTPETSPEVTVAPNR